MEFLKHLITVIEIVLVVSICFDVFKLIKARKGE